MTLWLNDPSRNVEICRRLEVSELFSPEKENTKMREVDERRETTTSLSPTSVTMKKPTLAMAMLRNMRDKEGRSPLLRILGHLVREKPRFRLRSVT